MRLLIATNRGPFEHLQDPQGKVELVPAEGGVATALRASASSLLATFICSPITEVDRQVAQGFVAPTNSHAADQRFVELDSETYGGFYDGFSNQVLWLLQHGLSWSTARALPPDAEQWFHGYSRANQAFAEAVAKTLDQDEASRVLFNDYHLYLAPRFLRNIRPDAVIQHFVHIPWPEPAAWDALNPRVVACLCEGLLGSNAVVFQTALSADNFLRTCQAYLPDTFVDIEKGLVEHAGSLARVWNNPISVDPDELLGLASTAEFHELRRRFAARSGEKLIVRVDRLDPSKNILEGFEAYRRLLKTRSELRARVRFLAFLVPSRQGIHLYRQYAEDVIAMADRINQEFGREGWLPVDLVVGHDRTRALAGLSQADVVLVNSIADGMNLVAKEAAIVNDRDAVLVLSRTAGAFEELKTGAVAIEPGDVRATAEALHAALVMDAGERSRRAREMRSVVMSHDLKAWLRVLVSSACDEPRTVRPSLDRRPRGVGSGEGERMPVASASRA